MKKNLVRQVLWPVAGDSTVENTADSTDSDTVARAVAAGSDGGGAVDGRMEGVPKTTRWKPRMAVDATGLPTAKKVMMTKVRSVLEGGEGGTCLTGTAFSLSHPTRQDVVTS